MSSINPITASADTSRADHRQSQVAHRLAQAMSQGQLQVVYQPEVSLSSRQVTSLEALCRWDDAELGQVAPDEFIVVEMLKADPDFANEYLAVALEEADQPGGQQAMLTALRHIAEAQGMSSVAERAGIPRESLYRALGPRGNPTIKTLLAVLSASGLHLSVARA